MKVEKKYPEFNQILVTIESQEEIDTLRTALLVLDACISSNVVQIGEIKTTTKRMVDMSGELRRIIENSI